MTAIKNGWLVEPRPVFFDDERQARAFQATYGGKLVRAKHHTAGDGGAPSGAHATPSDAPSDQLGELTEDDFAC